MRNLVAKIPGARVLKRALWGARANQPTYISIPRERGTPNLSCQSAMCRGGSQEVGRPDTFVLYRIIGNDLVPRHEKGQSRKNLEFILENESDLPGCEKRFVINRLVDLDEECQIIELLEAAGMPYIHIPFEWEVYKNKGWDISGVPVEYAPFSNTFDRLHPSSQAHAKMRLYRHKNNYVMNNNGARNVALRDGKKRAKWVLPWDGNCFLTESAWEEIRKSVTSRPDIPYHIIPMARVTDNSALLDPNFSPEAVEEPQVLFRSDSKEEFDPEYYYGRRPKVEFFWRLGVPGKWDSWPVEPWDLACPEYSEEAGQFSKAGWVARLFSGKPELEKQRDEKAWVGRGEARNEAIAAMIETLDARAFDARLVSDATIFAKKKLSNDNAVSVLEELRSAVASALGRGPYSVVDKTTLPPSKELRDYWHPAPYYWPHPLKIPGLPYVHRDGERVPGTRLYEPLSERYDRTRVQYLFDDTYTLALGLQNFQDSQCGLHGAELVRNWFLNPETAMNPHLKFAQVRRGHNKNRGVSRGIIELKDFYYFLDAVRILKAGGFLNDGELIKFENWLGEYLHWLRKSQQGVGERSAHNNHGTYYDLQVAAISAFLGEARVLRETLRDSRFRILDQFCEDGSQPRELARTTSAHYCCFNLQGWMHLAQIAESVGEDLWDFKGKSGAGIKKGMEWLLSHLGKPWPYEQISEFDEERILPIAHCYSTKFGNIENLCGGPLPAASSVKPLFFPHDGIRPFWNIGLADNNPTITNAVQAEQENVVA